MNSVNREFMEMVNLLFQAFEARQGGDKFGEAKDLLEAAAQKFHWAVEEELEKLERQKKYDRAMSE